LQDGGRWTVNKPATNERENYDIDKES